MKERPAQLTLAQWDSRYKRLRARGLKEPWYGGRLSRHVADGDTRLERLRFDDSAEALRLWNFLLTEDERLEKARRGGRKLVGTMKDLGTVPVMAYSLPGCVAFYPDGAFWIPCVMESNTRLLEVADKLGVDDSFCPVRAMLGAFVTKAHFPMPDLLVCSVGATCDDFSAVAQRLEGLGHPILWWEMPHRRPPEAGEAGLELPGGFRAASGQVELVREELTRVKDAIARVAGAELAREMLAAGIRKANRVRACLEELRTAAFTAELAPLPALELLIAEMLAIHYCSDQDEALSVLAGLLARVKRRVREGTGYFGRDAVKVFWLNPVADLRVMNLLEGCGGRVCGTEYLFAHALDRIPTDVPPMEALARMALADPMAGSAHDRAARVCRDIERFGSEAVMISRIPGASHCALESRVIADAVRARFGIPVAELELPPITDAFRSTLETRLCALVETVRRRRGRGSGPGCGRRG